MTQVHTRFNVNACDGDVGVVGGIYNTTTATAMVAALRLTFSIESTLTRHSFNGWPFSYHLDFVRAISL